MTTFALWLVTHTQVDAQHLILNHNEGGLVLQIGALLPAFFVELIAPFFRPIGVGAGLRDLVGLLLALPVPGLFIFFGRRSPEQRSWRLGLVLSGLALLPVFHVLPNDGGQWYLLLPSLGAALAWGGRRI